MPQREFLVIDVGTSSVKAALMDDRGTVIAIDRYPINSAQQAQRGVNAQDWLNALGQIVPALVADRTIAALAISGNGPTVVTVDDTGTVLGEPLLWLDPRTAGPVDGTSYYLGKVRWLYERYGDAALSRAGNVAELRGLGRKIFLFLQSKWRNRKSICKYRA